MGQLNLHTFIHECMFVMDKWDCLTRDISVNSFREAPDEKSHSKEKREDHFISQV